MYVPVYKVRPLGDRIGTETHTNPNEFGNRGGSAAPSIGSTRFGKAQQGVCSNRMSDFLPPMPICHVVGSLRDDDTGGRTSSIVTSYIALRKDFFHNFTKVQ